ncbi:MAG: hypothetical protein ACSLEW_07605 [Nocardioides sp.]
MAFADEKVDYPTNDQGMTYGAFPSESTQDRAADSPDLVLVIGDNNVEGYVYNSESFADDEAPSSPEEAIKQQDSSSGRRVISVYADDGKTVVDTFTIVRPDATLSTTE